MYLEAFLTFYTLSLKNELNIAFIQSVFFLLENLEVAVHPVWLNHVEVGRYFEKFCKTHYVPNAEKQMEYPQDDEVRLQFVACAKSK
jgi:hypothetical protein